MVETPCGGRVRFGELPCRARELINDIREHHHKKRIEKLRGRENAGYPNLLSDISQKYAELIEVMSDFKPTGVTHFRIAKTGDVVFVTNSRLYGQSFKRLWSIHLPLC